VAAVCVPADGDHLAVVGANRRLLVFPLDQVPEMARGAGVILQRDQRLRDTRALIERQGKTPQRRVIRHLLASLSHLSRQTPDPRRAARGRELSVAQASRMM